jgi:SpoVK/Ycf46/Vps4 family AAA+-type ATPase
MSERVVVDARAYNHYFRRINISRCMDRDAMSKALETNDLDSVFLLCLPELRCFALQHKKWARAWISDLEEVEFNDLAYPSLRLPHDYKELLLAFAEAQIDGYGFDDVIAGKGQGILMLLAGSPGTGKTLTAESMAEHMKRPLYSISAGELGSSAGGMEQALDRVLELSTRWNAVLLLDEADVFLLRRTDNDINRNSIVSVFLRKLEYYRGIMFLTTNRVHSIDDAFKSRIHIAIRYPDLDTETRLSIWRNFIRRTTNIYQYGIDIAEDDINQLAELELNGREIRNVVKSAQLLASRTKQPLQKRHLDTVWRVEHQESAFFPEPRH